MTQVSNYVLPGPPATGAVVLPKINDIFAAIQTLNAGATAPPSPVAGMPWLDTSGATPLLKVRNQANDAWVSVLNYSGMSAMGLTLANAANDVAVLTALGILATPAEINRAALQLFYTSGIITPTTPSVVQSDISADARWVEVTFFRLSQSSSGNMIIRPRVAGATVSTGYEAVEGIGAASSFGAAAHTDGFEISFGTATRFVSGVLRLTRHGTSNNWLASGMFGRNGEAAMPLVSGDVSLSGPLDGIAILAGAGDFDSGSVCINWGA
jgi:hypothetical protein